MTARVECRSEYTYAERPVALHWQGERLAVAQIIRCWRSPTGNNFSVQTDDGRNFELYYDEVAGEWDIHPLQ